MEPEEVLTPMGPSTGCAEVRMGSREPKVFSKTQYHSDLPPNSGRLTISNSKEGILSLICKNWGTTCLIEVHWALL